MIHFDFGCLVPMAILAGIGLIGVVVGIIAGLVWVFNHVTILIN